MRLDSFTRSGALHNEDSFAITPTFGFVLDGATGLLKENITGMVSDAQWFVKEWKFFLENNLQKTAPLKDILKQGVNKIDAKYMTLSGAENVKSKPSAAIALYRVINNKLEYFLLGDCSLVITKKSGQVLHLQPQELSFLDQANIDRMTNLSKEKNIDVIKARDLINDYLLKTRLTQNTPEGYYILSDSLEAIDNAMVGELDFSEIKQIVVVSDGYSQIFDTFNLLTIDKFADLVEGSASLGELYNVLWNLQEKDKGCNNYPRFKIRDDATVIVFSV